MTTDKLEVAPVKSLEDCAKLRRICAKIGGWVHLFHEISLETGWRTSDVCRLRFDNINFKTGKTSITVAKQTRAAQTKAFRTLARKFIAPRLDAPDLTIFEYRRLTTLKTEAEFKTVLTDTEFALCQEAASKAKVKPDSKTLSANTVKMIERLREKDSGEEYVFARQFTEARNRKDLDGHISRQAVWKRFKQIGEMLENDGVTFTPGYGFSAYSLRKTYIYRVYANAKAKGKDGLSTARDAVGHSDIAVTKRYVMLDYDEAQEISAELFKQTGKTMLNAALAA
ncbi:integrase [Buttiauxella sp. BIGb0471]|uniref:tyrosine-type recombinase/integrase n=1 Tax=Buttiauxella sp. BIGb0471 TaxID=2940597 RepID=UPI00216744F6|nr:tyrosine-type recombinase/integrase [Buttiauxella sp. BIGb0471]MCS3605046.1 integrase [Buttiauxella sp. BIGb0471]